MLMCKICEKKPINRPTEHLKEHGINEVSFDGFESKVYVPMDIY